MTKHIPVLLSEVMDLLQLRPGMTVADATLGGGGYGKELVVRIGSSGTYVGIDRDEEAVRRAETSDWVHLARESGETVYCVHANFERIREVFSSIGIDKVDAIVADLGISSDQLEDADRGLSFLSEGHLDMRLDRTETLRAWDIANTWEKKDIVHILKAYADERNANRIAEKIVNMRKERSIETTRELAEAVRSVIPRRMTKKADPATKTFMAFRMAVNRELQSLEVFLSEVISLVRPGGKIAVVTFHSGEDRLVKHTFREWARGCVCPKMFPVCRCGKNPRVRLVTKKSIVPKKEERERNPRARSARLRIAEVCF